MNAKEQSNYCCVSRLTRSLKASVSLSLSAWLLRSRRLIVFIEARARSLEPFLSLPLSIQLSPSPPSSILRVLLSSSPLKGTTRKVRLTVGSPSTSSFKERRGNPAHCRCCGTGLVYTQTHARTLICITERCKHRGALSGSVCLLLFI